MLTIIKGLKVSVQFHALHTKADIQNLLGRKEQAKKSQQRATDILSEYSRDQFFKRRFRGPM